MILDVRDRQIAIVGGGAVARRKALTLLKCGATCLRAVAPTFRPDFPGVEEKLTRIVEPYRPEHLAGAELVFATTDNAEVNDRVVRDGRAIGAWVYRADGGEESGDFSNPATSFRGSGIMISVSAAGSPALATYMRDRLDQAVETGWESMVDHMADLRPRVLKSSLDSAARAEVFRALATEEAIEVLTLQQQDGLWKWLVARFPELDL